jgi:hypothetical protein
VRDYESMIGEEEGKLFYSSTCVILSFLALFSVFQFKATYSRVYLGLEFVKPCQVIRLWVIRSRFRMTLSCDRATSMYTIWMDLLKSGTMP